MSVCASSKLTGPLTSGSISRRTNVSKSYVIEVAEKKPGASFLTCLIFAVTMFCLAKACEGKHYHGTNTTQAPVVTLNG